MLFDIGRGAAYLAKGFSIMKTPGIRKYVIMPLLLNILLFGGLVWFGYTQISQLIDWMLAGVPAWLGFLEGLIWLLISFMAVFIVFFTFTPIANIVAAPFNAIMAEKIEEQLTGDDINSGVSLSTLIIDSIKSQFGKLVYILLWSAGLFLFSLIPLINLIAPALWVIFGAWLLTLEYMDYPMGNHDLSFAQQKQQVKSRRGLALGFGGSVMVMTSIPLINFLVMPMAVAGATVMWVEQMRPRGNKLEGTETA
jgi:CysZ protein